MQPIARRRSIPANERIRLAHHVSLVESKQLLIVKIKQLATVRVKMIDGSEGGRVSVEMAVCLVAAGGYGGCLSRSGKLRYLRQMRDPLAFEPSWRNSEAAVLQPYAVTGEYQIS